MASGKILVLIILFNSCLALLNLTSDETPEIEYTHGLLVSLNNTDSFSFPADYFEDFDNDTTTSIVENTDTSDHFTMIIPKSSKTVKEIDARQMKQIKENGSAGYESITFKNNQFKSLARILNFYSSDLLIEHWSLIKEGLQPQCLNDVQEYIEGLRDGTSWALRMDDSSGRYTSGFFWGNNYWAGSQVECLNIAPDIQPTDFPLKASSASSPIAAKLIQKENSDRKKREVDEHGEKSRIISPSFGVGYQPGKLTRDALPNFAPSFFLMRIHLNSSQEITPYTRIIHMGVCMPLSCTPEQIKGIVEQVATETVDDVKIKISAVRSQYTRFVIWEDVTFIILFTVTAIVTSLIIAGTLYDIYLLRKQKKQMVSNCITYDMTKAEHQMEKHITLEIGKSGMYVVNNDVAPSDENLKSSETNLVPFSIGGILGDLLLAFSVRINMNTICDPNIGCDTIPTIHGIRAISMAWVILGHTLIIAFKYADNMEYRKVVEKEFLFQTVTNGVYSVDSFFFISGLLVSFLYFRTTAKGTYQHITEVGGQFVSGFLQFWGMIGYRFARLTVPYLYVLGVVEVCMKWFNYNAVFEPPADDHINCPKYWWRNILYINTFYPVEEMCMLWSWYLSDDTQFYIVGIIFLIIAVRYFKTAAVLVSTFMISSWVITAYVAYINNHMPNLDDPLVLFDKLYAKPWTRLGPYFIGMSVGYLLFKTDCRIRMSKLTLTVGWLLSITCLLSLVYGLYETELSRFTAAAYSSLSHTAWALCLAWIVVACSTGYGGWVNKILSAPILYPFSRITYCAYLIHPLCIRYMTMQMDSPLHLSSEVMAFIYIGQTVVSYILSFVISLAFEAPVVAMLRVISVNMKKFQ